MLCTEIFLGSVDKLVIVDIVKGCVKCCILCVCFYLDYYDNRTLRYSSGFRRNEYAADIFDLFQLNYTFL